jgi:CubicO group peptidase (beta-lactamase class C family)
VTSLRQEVERLVEAVHERTGIPGIAVSLSVRGEQLGVAVGVNAVGRNVPMSPQSRFQIGCITKMLTTLVALDLALEGRLCLDAPVEEYLPELEGIAAVRGVALRHLASHTSGYQGLSPAVPEFGYFYSWPKFVEFMRRSRQIFAPGTTFTYEHTACVLLGEVIQRVSGGSAEELVRAKIISPLKLSIGALGGDGAEQGEPVGDHDFDGRQGRYRAVRAVPFCDFWKPSLSNWTAGTAALRSVAEFMIGARVCDVAPDAVTQARAQEVRLPALFGGPRCEQMPVSFGSGCAGYEGQLFGHNGSGRGQTCGIRFNAEHQLALVVALNAWQPCVRDMMLNAISDLVKPRDPKGGHRPDKLGLDLRDFEGTYSGCAGGSQLAVSRDGNDFNCDVCDGSAVVKARIVITQDENGRVTLKSDSQHLCVGFFVDAGTGTPCIMLGLNAFRKYS